MFLWRNDTLTREETAAEANKLVILSEPDDGFATKAASNVYESEMKALRSCHFKVVTSTFSGMVAKAS